MSEYMVQAEAQTNAFVMMYGDEVALIEKHGEEFRDIIIDYYSRKGRCPTSDELVWEASRHAGRDLRK